MRKTTQYKTKQYDPETNKFQEGVVVFIPDDTMEESSDV